MHWLRISSASNKVVVEKPFLEGMGTRVILRFSGMERFIALAAVMMACLSPSLIPWATLLALASK
ncbi:hypothetical protein AAA137_00475 [Phocaeicola vulgatus]